MVSDAVRYVSWTHGTDVRVPDDNTGAVASFPGTSNPVDATVAVSAAQRGDIIVTSNPDDLQLFADDLPGIRVLSL